MGLALASMAAARPVHAGKLGDLRSETEGSSSSSSAGGSGSDGGSDSSDTSSSGDWGAALGEAMIDAYVETVWRLYTRYPYEPGTKGYVHIIPEDTAPSERIGQKLSGSFAIDGAHLGPGLGRAGLDVQLMVRRFGLHLDFSPHVELDARDALMLGSTALMFAPILRPRWQLYAGVGVGAMIDGRVLPRAERSDAAGFNATFQTTVLPIRPLVLRGRFDLGTLGAAQTMLGRGTVGALVQRWEIFGGYEARRVGDVVLHGPTAGARVWF